MPPSADASFTLFVACAPGCEELLARELATLGLTGETTVGGVSLSADEKAIYTVNVRSRLAGRVLLRVATFAAKSFGALEHEMKAIRFGGRFDKKAALAVRVSCSRSKLYHTKAVAERVYTALGNPQAPASHLDEDDAPPATLLVRIENDQCTVSVDTSGAHLHKRGYRLATAKAPLRETLAAALLAAADYRGDTALVDPMCGSGTIAIEAALMAARKAPGLDRRFAFEGWPAFTPRMFDSVLDEARDAERAIRVPITASDRDSGAIEAAKSNAERAGVRFEIVERPLSKAAPNGKIAGLFIANPPYGTRIGDTSRLRDLYAAIGNAARGPFEAWRSAFITTDAQLAHAAGAGFTTPHPPMAHGGLKVRLWLRAPG